MADPTAGEGPAPGGTGAEREELDAVVDIVARCLERIDREGERAIEEVCRVNPRHEAQIRERLAVLQRLGLADRAPSQHRAFGRYTLLRELGRGGMGVVYLAEDPQLNRRVALKALSSRLIGSERARSRFEREIRAIAQVKHPHIVPIYEVGEADGIPYFTMEFVEGRTLGGVIHSLRRLEVPTTDLNTTHLGLATFSDDGEPNEDSDADEPSSHALREPISASELPRLPKSWGSTYVETVCHMMLDVADALEHAHQSGVVHRDIKPSNILICRDGRAQLFDFGLARLESDDTITLSGDFAGTPCYVSPEQARGREVDHRTDIYALGITLYELLTLRRPFEGKNAQQVFRQIQTREPPLLRKVNRMVPRDLETICLTAIEKDPGKRYRTARELADDLRRFLQFRPVLARPVGMPTRLVRLVRRNPAPAAAAVLALLLFVASVAGLIGLGAHNRLIAAENERANEAAARANLEAERAKREEDRARSINAFLRSMLSSVKPGRLGHDATVRELLDQSSTTVGVDFEDQPDVEAALRETIGNTYFELGLFDEAEQHLRRALELFERYASGRNNYAADARRGLARVLLALNRYEEAEEHARHSLELWEALDIGDQSGHALALVTLGAIVAERHLDYEQADRLFREALDMRLRLHGELSGAVADVYSNLANLRSKQAKFGEGYHFLEKALEIRLAIYGPDHASVAEVMRAIGSFRHSGGRSMSALETLESVLEVQRETMGDEHPRVAGTLVAIGNIHRRHSNLDEAERLFRQALDIDRRVYGGDHLEIANVLSHLGQVMQQRGRLDEAEDFLRETFDMQVRLLGADHPEPAGTAVYLAHVYQGQGRLEEAAETFRHSLEVRRELLPPDHPSLGTSHYTLGNIELALGQLGEARHHLEEALRIQREIHGDGRAVVVMTKDALRELYVKTGELEKAEDLARDLVRVYCNLHGGSQRSVSGLLDLARLLYLQGEDDESEALFREALSWQRQNLPPGSAEICDSLGGLAELLIEQDRLAEAEALLFEALSRLRRARGLDHRTTIGAQVLYARCLSFLDRPEEAEPLLLDAWARFLGTLGPGASLTQRTAAELGHFYEDWGMDGEAIEFAEIARSYAGL